MLRAGTLYTVLSASERHPWEVNVVDVCPFIGGIGYEVCFNEDGTVTSREIRANFEG